jgi:hypothetical protein
VRAKWRCGWRLRLCLTDIFLQHFIFTIKKGDTDMTTLSEPKLRLRKSLRYGLLALLLSVAPTVQANAATITITDQNPADLNSITGQNYNDLSNTLVVTENYNETHLIPYPSHDGMAVVNSSLNYFDKVITFSGVTSSPTTLQFVVTNTTPYNWSDYHIELWNSTFTTRLSSSLVTSYSNTVFTNMSNSGGIVTFWAPGSQSGNPADGVGTYTIQANLLAVNGSGDGSFGIRQVATAPEPGTIMLLGIGGLGMLGMKHAKRREAEVA